ncbi:hypothetical protein BDF19DRAFT_438775 [Syncephalis fuscata]|nr:hypothetical protein BDF19DRAFT_438775 [Syncephalis fuscata]
MSSRNQSRSAASSASSNANRRRSSATSPTAASAARAAHSTTSPTTATTTTTTRHVRSSSSSSSSSTRLTSSTSSATAARSISHGPGSSSTSSRITTTTSGVRPTTRSPPGSNRLDRSTSGSTVEHTYTARRRRSKSNLSADISEGAATANSTSSSRSSSRSSSNSPTASSRERRSTVSNDNSTSNSVKPLSRRSSTTNKLPSPPTSVKSSKKANSPTLKSAISLNIQTPLETKNSTKEIIQSAQFDGNNQTIVTYEQIDEEVVSENQLIKKIKISDNVQTSCYYRTLPDGSIEEIEKISIINDMPITPVTKQQTLVTVVDEQVQLNHLSPDEKRDAERIFHAAANARHGMKGKLGLLDPAAETQFLGDIDATSTSKKSVKYKNSIEGNETKGKLVSTTIQTVQGDLFDSEDDEEEPYTLTIHPHWDREKVSVMDLHEEKSSSRLDTMSPTKLIPSAINKKLSDDSVSVVHEEDTSTTYANVTARSRPSTSTTTFITEINTTVVESGHLQVRDRGFIPGSGMMARLAAKGAADEMAEFVEDTTETYVPKPITDAASKAASTVSGVTTQLLGKPPTEFVTSVKEQLVTSLKPDDDDDDGISWRCRACREERAKHAHWLDWFKHPLITVLDHINPQTDDVPCEQHRTLKQKLNHWLPTWLQKSGHHGHRRNVHSGHSTQTRETNGAEQQNERQSWLIPYTAIYAITTIRTKATATVVYYANTVLPLTPAAPVTSNDYASAEHDIYGRRLSSTEQARRFRLTERAQQRITGLRGKEQDDEIQKRGVIANTLGTAVGMVVGLSMAAIDTVWH